MVAAAAATFMAAPAYAQNINTGATGSFGQVQLRAGFTPDPHSVTVSAGGEIDSTRASADCTAGYITSRPQFSLRYTPDGRPLYIGATSDVDSTIVVRTPNGQWICNDDSDGSLNPLATVTEPRRGRYQIWVGRFGTQSELSPAVLHISEIAAATEEASGGTPDFSLDPAYGAIELTAGFTPDPHAQEIAAGGNLQASVVGENCAGWIAQAPDYRVTWTAGSGQLPLVFSVNSEADTTLVINDAQGNWVCDDDSGNGPLNPSISFQNAPSGQYDVWVGTYAEGELQPSVLQVSEVSSQ